MKEGGKEGGGGGRGGGGIRLFFEGKAGINGINNAGFLRLSSAPSH